MLPKIKNLVVRLFGNEYDVGFGRWPSGFTVILLVNRRTQAVLPTVMGGSTTDPRQVQVLEVGGLRKALEAAGVVRKTGETTQPGLGKLAVCEIVHAEVLDWLKRPAPETLDPDLFDRGVEGRER